MVETLAQYGKRADELINTIFQQRLRYDFELFCFQGVHIRRKDGQIAPMVLNYPQRRYANLLLERFFSGSPLRIILLKARQWGGSTLTQAFFAWVQLFHRHGWNAAVVTEVQDQARHIMGMYETLADHYENGTITLSSYHGSQNVKFVEEAGSYIGVASVQNPNAVRSYTYHMLHLSEVGLWPSTTKVSAESLAQALMAGIPNLPFTACIMESTAKGVGNYFHRAWQKAESGKSNFHPLFIPWYQIEEYELEVDDPEPFIESWDEYERGLWEAGATIEAIAWYRYKLRDFNGDTWRMQSEFPTTAQEAFQSTGHRFFSAPAVQRQRTNNVRIPVMKARIKSPTNEGKAALQDIQMVSDENGPVWVWSMPKDDPYKIIPPNHAVSNRFCGFADFGGKSGGADWSITTIIDRLPMLRGGVPEVAARYRAHLRPDLFAWDAARLAQLYDQALLAYEINRHNHDRGDDIRGYEPEWSLAVLDEIRNVYGNLYMRMSPSRADEREDMEIGFHTNVSTKPMILNVLDACLDEDEYVERDARALDECDTFEKKPDGRLGAVDGCHDDIVISTAGSLWLATSYMPPVSVYPIQKQTAKKAVGAAIFN